MNINNITSFLALFNLMKYVPKDYPFDLWDGQSRVWFNFFSSVLRENKKLDN